jgi:murein DD-endopeptidase
MKKQFGLLLFSIVIAFFSNITLAQTRKYVPSVQAPSAVDVLDIDSNPTAYYELYLTNFSPDTFKLKNVSILDISDSSILFEMRNQELKESYSKIGSVMKDTSMSLTPGNYAVIYVELTMQKQIKEITHSISFDVVGKEHSGEFSIQTSTTRCYSDTQLVLGAPLKGGPWTAVYEPSWERGHRRVIYTVDGKARIPGRYAIDFIKMESNGKYAKGDENIIRNWFGYSVDVLAVADGTVSSVRDDFSESLTLSEHPKYTADKATGNYISIKIGDNQFTFYEHLKPKSIRVKIGQKVKKGDVIASLGFTGQTTGPHLHFHVSDADSPLGAQGIPFVFDCFEYLGIYKNLVNFGKTTWIRLENSKHLNRKNERPSPNAVIKFR